MSTDTVERVDDAALLLIIEDNATHRYILASWLKRAGHTLLEVGDGTEAFNILSERARDGLALPDLAVVDVHLPDMSGFEVCERIKSDPATAGTPVIHVSATAIAPSDRTQGLDRGADAYLAEPIAPGELIATVAAALRYSRARVRAESLAARLGVLNEATLEIYGASQAPALAAAVAKAANRLFGVAAVVLTQSPHSDAVHLNSGLDGRAPVSRLVSADLLAQLVGKSLGNRVGVATAQATAPLWPGGDGLIPLAGEVTVTAARTKRGRPPVVVAVGAIIRQDEDRKLLTQLTQTAALALEALRSYTEEHALAVTLQRAFLPARLPRADGIELAVRYMPAEVENEIGGDFYEAVHTRAGLLLAVGDVAGHSMEAAIVMGGLRHALVAYTFDGAPLHEILEKLDRLMYSVWPGWTATVCLVLIASGGREIEIANAGHLPPLLRGPGGACELVREHGPILGALLPQRPAVRRPVAAGTGILLVTDGLVESRGVDLLISLEALRRAAAAAPENPDALCDTLLEVFRRPQEDDIVLFAARIADNGQDGPGRADEGEGD
jgi:CheY-like chemotaxis protein/serine phosphatase RsbU (regulator of sigma subunit)